jgi:hypothetical protein
MIAEDIGENKRASDGRIRHVVWPVRPQMGTLGECASTSNGSVPQESLEGLAGDERTEVPGMTRSGGVGCIVIGGCGGLAKK